MGAKKVPAIDSSPDAGHLAQRAADQSGEYVEEAERSSTSEPVSSEEGDRPDQAAREEPAEIARRCSRRPLIDKGTDDQIIGYDDRGLPR